MRCRVGLAPMLTWVRVIICWLLALRGNTHTQRRGHGATRQQFVVLIGFLNFDIDTMMNTQYLESGAGVS